MALISAIPQQIVLTTGNGQNYLSWAETAGATNYVVQRSLTGLLGSFATIASPTVNEYLDTTVSVGVQYWYQVGSVSSQGASGFNATGTDSLPLSCVPALPGQIPLFHLRKESKRKADKLHSNFVTEDEWNFNLNQSSNRLYDLLVRKFGEKYFLAEPVQFASTSAQSYDLPNGANYSGAPALYKLAGVDVSGGLGNNRWQTVSPFNWIDRNKFATLQLSGVTTAVNGIQYCENGGKIFFIPQPSAMSIQLWYVPMLTQMLQDTDMMPFSISGWSELVIVDAAIKALIKEESYDQAATLMKERSEILERIETTAPNRDVGTPNTVSNTRAAAGDPNFPNFGFGSGWGSGWGQ